jgi:hypothetical protein
MDDTEYRRQVMDKFNEYLNLIIDEKVIGITVVIVNSDLTAKADVFGNADILMIGALDYVKHGMLDKNLTKPMYTVKPEQE